MIKVLGFQLGVGQCAQAMLPRPLKDVAGQLFQFGPGELAPKAELRRQEGQGDFNFRLRGKLDLRQLRCFADA